jgi:nitroimidazol reductase NimA-like FMN-containing flavoprotein (pyridoxamine 5'-phosphate oxidase superfamily)
MRGIRRKEKEIKEIDEMKEIIKSAKYVTIAMCLEDTPYLATLSHGYDEERNCIYFHCASEGKKVEILRENNLIWGQAIADHGYVHGQCDHLWATTQFQGRVHFVVAMDEKYHALRTMIHSLDDSPEDVEAEHLSDKSVSKVTIGRIDIDEMSGKKAREVVISL